MTSGKRGRIGERKGPTGLAAGFVSLPGRLDPAAWDSVLERFRDSSIYQSYAYEATRVGAGHVHHLRLIKEGIVVAAAQARILRLPPVRGGMAYVRWGPLWRGTEEHRDPEIFRQAIRALRNEYTIRRGYLLRIYPLLVHDDDGGLQGVLAEEGYREQPGKTGGRTLLLDLRPAPADLRKNFDQKWRNCLHHAERNGLEVVEGESDELFGAFIALYGELLDRKGFSEPNDIREFRAIQNGLPPGRKMRIFLCRAGDKIGAGAIASAFGERGVYLFGATNESGLSMKGSYLVQWRLIQWLKDQGCVWYDLNGINPDRNPGTYRFKSGVAGKTGRDVRFLGFYDCFVGARGRILSRYGDKALSLARNAKALLRSPLRKRSR